MGAPLPAQPVALDALHTLLLSAPEVETFLCEVAELAAGMVGTVTSVGITVRYGGELLTVASRDARAATRDPSKCLDGQGPCLEALMTGQVVGVSDQHTQPRFEGFQARARAHGVFSILSLPLFVDGTSIGALSLFSTVRATPFGDDVTREALAFAQRTSTALALTIRYAEQVETSRQLERTLAARTVIDQAIGILMAQQRCDAHQAFDLLRRHSQNHNRKLRTVAEGLIARVSGGQPVAGHPFEQSPRA